MNARVRPARRTDRKPLLDFIKDVWGGHDYIPEVWDDWYEDKRGRMFVVEDDGKPVGMNRVRFMDDGSAWFEGARVHPSHRGKGLASLLGENSMKVAKEKGVSVFRLTSNSRNRTAHRQIARMRFDEVARVSIYSPDERTQLSPQRNVRVASGDDLGEVERMVHSSREYALGAGVMWESFAATRLTSKVLRGLIRDKSVLMAGAGVAVARRGGEGKELWNQVCFLGGDPADALKLARHIFADPRKAAWSIAYMPHGSPIIGALRAGGFRRSTSLILFERRANG